MKICKRLAAFMLALLMAASVMPSIKIDAHAADVEEMTNVVVFAHFKDDGKGNYFNSRQGIYDHAGKQIKEFYNGDYGRSLKQYMNTVSGGELKVNTVFPQMDSAGNVTAYELPYTVGEAQTKEIDYDIITAILKNADLKITDNIDKNDDGVVDNLTIILVGGANSNAASMPSLYPHQNSYPGDAKLGGKFVENYNMLNTERLIGIKGDETGLIIHEFMHSLGYPDLYRKTNEDYPVYTWDIMGQSSKYVSWPLAYMREHFSGWTKLPELKTSAKNVEIAKANEAVILKAPGNPYELFVVESRVRSTDSINENTLDAGIGGSGLIVYRVDTTVNALSNNFGKTGVYIFRKDAGKTTDAIRNAYRTDGTIGSDDKNTTLENGALSYSDGTNSRIKIDIKSFDTGTGAASFDVSMPAASEYDSWYDTGFNDGSIFSKVAACTVNGTPYAVGVVNDNTAMLYKYGDNGWKSVVGAAFSLTGELGDLQLLEYGDGMILLYTTDADSDFNGYKESLKTLKFNFREEEKWDTVSGPEISLSGSDEFKSFSADAMNGDIYVNYVFGDYRKAAIVKLNDQDARFKNIKEYLNETSGLYGSPVITADSGKVYYGIRNLGADDKKIDIWVYNGTSHILLQNPVSDEEKNGAYGAYNIKSNKGKLYCAFGFRSNNPSKPPSLKVKLYDSSSGKWNDYAEEEVDSFELEMAVAQGNVYIVTKPSTVGDKKLFVYALQEKENGSGELVQEGEPVAIPSDSGKYGLIASKDNLFTYYIKDVGGREVAAISRKTTVNKLMSLTITPPGKLRYVKGEGVNNEGLEVTANYVNTTKKLTKNDYKIENFDTNTAGERTATIEYEGKENTFTYWVFEAAQPSEDKTPTEDDFTSTTPESSQTATGKSDTSSQTGDDSNLALRSVLMLAALAGIGGTALYSRKKKTVK